MSRQLHRCTPKLLGRTSVLPRVLRTAARPGQQRSISQLAAASNNDGSLSAATSSPAAPVSLDYSRFEGHTTKLVSRYGSRSYYTPTATTTSSGISSIRWFSSDDKGADTDKKEEKGETEAKPEVKEEKKEETKAEEKGASADKAEEAPTDAAAAAAKEPEVAEGEECPPWMNPLHFDDPGPHKEFAEDFAPGEEMPILEAPPLEDPENPDKVLASQEMYDLSDEIVNLSMLEMKELVTKIGDHFGFEKPPFTGSDGSGGDGDADGDDEGEAEAKVEKTAFDLRLVSFDPKSKIKVIKEVRALAGLGLKEAKEMVEGSPKIVMKDISKDSAEELQKKLEAVGAVVEIV